MPPPPLTPSPHRFVIKKPAPVGKTPLAQEQTPQPRPPSTQPQFKAAPRFTLSSTPRPAPTQSLPASTQSVTRFATPARQHEDVIENIESSCEGPVHDSIETEEQDIELGDLSANDEHSIFGQNPKRRRLTSSPEPHNEQEPQRNNTQDSLPDSSLPILSSPPAARHPISSTAPRFLLSTPAPPSTSHPPQSTQTAFLKPLRFRPPDPSEQAHTDPLPEHFSPHRRGHKYIAGGLAAEVRDWLVNLESALPGNAAGRARDDPWAVRVLVDEVGGGGRAGMVVVRGRQVYPDGIVHSSEAVRVLLAGDGAATGLQRGSKVEVGKTVGIKSPVWEVMLEGEKWGVGVDWKVLL